MNNRDKHILDNTGLVHSVMSKFSYTIDDEDDVYSEGIIGLMMAVDKFDPSYDVKFSTFAYKYIRGYILEYFKTKTFDDSLDEPLYNSEGEESMTKLDTYSSSDNVAQSYEDYDLFNFRMSVVNNILDNEPEQYATAYKSMMSGIPITEISATLNIPSDRLRKAIFTIDRKLNYHIFQKGLNYV